MFNMTERIHEEAKRRTRISNTIALLEDKVERMMAEPVKEIKMKSAVVVEEKPTEVVESTKTPERIDEPKTPSRASEYFNT